MDQYQRKRDNMTANYELLQRLNQEGNMEEFQYKLSILKSPKDLYFERLELIEEYVNLMKEKTAQMERFEKEDHNQFIEKMKKDRDDRKSAIKQREKSKREKEEAKLTKKKEVGEEAKVAKREAI